MQEDVGVGSGPAEHGALSGPGESAAGLASLLHACGVDRIFLERTSHGAPAARGARVGARAL